MNSSAKLARIVAIAVSGVWAAVIFFTGLDLDSDVRRGLAYLPSVVGLAVVAFDLWLWKIPGISKITGRPHLYGTWRATLTPGPNSRIPRGGNWGPIISALVIEQTFWTISVRHHTNQSNSASTTAAITTSPDSKQNKNLYFSYANRARQEHNERSYPHHGTTLLHVTGIRPTRLDGTYWTDRLTAGDISTERMNSKTDLSATDALTVVQPQGNP
jgi:hypothetical protein